MAHPTAVLNIVGLTRRLRPHTPRLANLAARHGTLRLRPVLPALTCSVQASMLCGLPPARHGIVGNGWYDRALNEVHFWKQSNRLVQAEQVWETAKRHDPSVTCANLFWWFNMASSADVTITPRPMYPADGRKIPDLHTQPAELRDWVQQRLGRFPLFSFWGPGAGIESSRWIAAAARLVRERFDPTLLLVYLPHLDYALQRYGPDDDRSHAAAAEIDAVAGELANDLERSGRRVVVLSEYGIERVDTPVEINRALRLAGLLRVREELGRELLDPFASDAFAVADHQIAHVYVRDAARLAEVAALCAAQAGVELVLDRAAQAAYGVDHERSGELVLVARRGAWFAYAYWLDDSRAPDFARTVDIHRKPGYDPLELLIDPRLRWPRFRVARKLLARRMGFRTLLDVIPLDNRLVRGSHGRVDAPADEQPLLIAPGAARLGDEASCTVVRDVILAQLFE